MLEAARVKTGLELANGEKTHALPLDWQTRRYQPALVKAGRADASLGLRLATADETRRYHNSDDEKLTGSEHVSIVTTAPAAVKAWLAAQQKGNGTGKAVKVETKAAANGGKGLPEKAETPAQKAKREAAEAKAREAERAAADERRRERGRVPHFGRVAGDGNLPVANTPSQ